MAEPDPATVHRRVVKLTEALTAAYVACEAMMLKAERKGQLRQYRREAEGFMEAMKKAQDAASAVVFLFHDPKAG